MKQTAEPTHRMGDQSNGELSGHSMDTTLDWEALQRYIEHGRFDELGRSKDLLLEMNDHMHKVKEEYASVRDYILGKFFQLPLVEVDVEEPDSIKDSASPISKGRKKQAIIRKDDMGRLAFALNDFPYNFTPNIKHYILWSLKPLTDEEIRDHISKLLTKGERYLVFSNLPFKQSIKDVFHVHVCVNNQPQTRP